MSPSPRLAFVIVIVSITCIFLPWQLGVLAGSAVLLVALAEAVVVLRQVRSSRDISRDVSHSLARGVPAPLTLRADGERTTTRIRQPLAPDLLIAKQEATGILDTEITATRRGHHTLPPPTGRTHGPLGLIHAYRKQHNNTEIVVFPDVPAARKIAVGVRSGIMRGEGAPSSSLLGLGTEFDSIRAYQPDDDIRQVNWRATARTGEPMSNQFRLEQERDLLCLIDTGRLMTTPIGELTQLDAALDAAIAVGLVADTVGDRCGAVAFDSQLRAIIKPRRGGGERLIRELYALEPRPIESDYTAAFQFAESLKRSLVIVFTDLFEPGAASPLISALPVLARKHAVVVACATDPLLQKTLKTQPRGELDLYLQTATLDVVNTQRTTEKTVARAGARTVVTQSDQLARACVNAYLNEKRRASF